MVALAGNPNVGKSTLFNTITGLHQHTGNWPGKTVDVAKGQTRRNMCCYEFVDLPGTYSLQGNSEDERIAGEYIASGDANCTVAVCDGNSLERSLILVLQILQMTDRVVVCVTLMDEAEKNGIFVEKEILETLLGVPVVLTSARDKHIKKKILDAIDTALQTPNMATKTFSNPIMQAQEIALSAVTVRTQKRLQLQRKTDNLLVSRCFGYGMMVLLLFVVLWITISGANYPSQLLGRGLDAVYHFLYDKFTFLPQFLKGLLLDGMYATSARVLSVMLPPMAIFFPLFTILEDVGYLPRMAFLLDGKMQKCGGCGKQALTMCMGLGCNAVGVMGCRIIDSPRERLIAILTNAMIPCNGRFPTLIVLSSAFFSSVFSTLSVALCVTLSICGAMLASLFLSKTVYKHEPSVFLMEMPPFRKPRFGNILVRSLLDRTLQISLRALLVSAPAGAVLWLFANTPAFQSVISFLDPVGRVVGLNGVILLAFFFSLPANELFLPVVFMAITGVTSLQNTQVVSSDWLANQWSLEIVICVMVFTLFHWPCATTLMTIYKETKSIKQTAVAFLLPTAVGVLLCSVLHGIFQLI